MTPRRSIPAEAIRQLFRERHAALARVLREARRAPTVARVHRARVTARSLRALLAVLGPGLAARDRDRARRDLRAMAAELGERRESDVRRTWLARLAATSGALAPGAHRALLRELERDRREATARLLRHLQSAACQERLARIEATLQDPRLVRRHGIPAGSLRRRLRSRWKKLRKGLEGAAADPEALHRLRIAAKNVRYASDALMPLLGLDAKPVLIQLRKLQDALGEYHDATEALAWIGQLGEPTGPVLEARLAAAIERDRSRRLKQLRRLVAKFEWPDLGKRALVSPVPARPRRSRAGAAAARPAGGRRAASR